MNGNRLNQKGHEIFFLGSLYGHHDGYDGSCFSIYGVAPALVASLGRVPHVIIKDEKYDKSKKARRLVG